MLCAEAIEGRQGFTHVSSSIVAFSGPKFLVVGNDHRVIVVTHEAHAGECMFFGVTQVTDDLDYRPSLVTTPCCSSLLLRAAIQQRLEHLRCCSQSIQQIL